LPANGASALDALSCPSAGNCVAGGDYGSAKGAVPFVAVQHNGTWGKPQLIPGMAALLGSLRAVVAVPRVIFCADSGDCTVIGDYPDNPGHRMDAFISTETGGAWKAATSLPGLAALQSTASTRYTDVDALACDPDGRDCTAAGVFTGPQGRMLPFILTKTGGSWGTVTGLPGTGSLNLSNGTGGEVLLACPAQAACTIATTAWTTKSPSEPRVLGNSQVYLEAEANGVWGTPRHLGGVTAADEAGAVVTALSCGAPGSCTIGGYSAKAHQLAIPFLAEETGGAWTGGPTRVSLPQATASTSLIGDLSCVAAGYCTATAYDKYPEFSVGKPTAFLIAEGAASSTALTLAKSALTYGAEQAETLTVTVDGPPAATAVVTAGTTALCTVHLTASGTAGTCTLTAQALKPGSYQLTASYQGSPVYLDSQSVPATLTVRG
jgi:hypothetical protein